MRLFLASRDIFLYERPNSELAWVSEEFSGTDGGGLRETFSHVEGIRSRSCGIMRRCSSTSRPFAKGGETEQQHLQTTAATTATPAPPPKANSPSPKSDPIPLSFENTC